MLKQIEKAKKCYKEGYNSIATDESKIEALKEARSFVNRHSEEWYYSGQELLGKLDAVIYALENY